MACYPLHRALSREVELRRRAVQVAFARAAECGQLARTVLTVITNVRAPVAVRNTCHHLMLAIEQNNQTLVDEILVSLARVADRTGFLLPPLVAPAAG